MTHPGVDDVVRAMWWISITLAAIVIITTSTMIVVVLTGRRNPWLIAALGFAGFLLFIDPLNEAIFLRLDASGVHLALFLAREFGPVIVGSAALGTLIGVFPMFWKLRTPSEGDKKSHDEPDNWGA